MSPDRVRFALSNANRFLGSARSSLLAVKHRATVALALVFVQRLFLALAPLRPRPSTSRGRSAFGERECATPQGRRCAGS